MYKYLLCGILLVASVPAQARDAVRAVGSSTVYPFMASVAEHFGKQSGKPTPLVVESGTGAGIADFCKGVGDEFPDLANASRPMKPAEKDICTKAGVKQVHEFTMGYDGIVLANAKKSSHLALTTNQVFLALAKQVPVNGKLVVNPYKKWSDIDKKLPGNSIEVYGPPSTSGTYDAFLEIVMQGACMELPEFKKQFPVDDARKKECSALRGDGVYKPTVENDNVIVQKLKANDKAVGIFGFSYLEQNRSELQGADINGIAPTFETISDASYPVARSLYVYVKGEHLKKFPEIKPLLEELFSEEAMGEMGYLPEQGLIPLHPDQLEAQRTKLKNL